jgi:rhamnosyltransferase
MDPTDSSMRCAAGIVTYNPEVSRLRESISAIAPQVDLLVIVDNASDDLVSLRREASACPTSCLLESRENAGMASALNMIAARCLGEGYEYVLLLDQDSVVDSDLVPTLLKCFEGNVGIVSPLVNDRNEIEHIAKSDDVYEVARTITSGSLLSLSAWRAVGGYDESLFVDWVDFEFCNNLRANGFRVLRTHGASILHELGHQEYVCAIPRRAANGKWVMRPYYRTNHPAVRRRDRARSEVITIRKYWHYPAIRNDELGIMLKAVVRGLLIEARRSELIRMTVRGALDGSRAPLAPGCNHDR